MRKKIKRIVPFILVGVLVSSFVMTNYNKAREVKAVVGVDDLAVAGLVTTLLLVYGYATTQYYNNTDGANALADEWEEEYNQARLTVINGGGVKHNGNTIYNIGNWKFGFTTASKVIDSARASSYITKYITKDLCSVTKFKKRYWSSRNCDRPKVRTYCLPYEEIGKFLDDNIHLLQYTKEVVIDSCGLAITYIEMKKE